MGRNETQLAALALHAQVGNAPALLVEILDQELSELLAAQRVKQQYGEDGPVALALEGAGGRRIQQRPGLRVAECRRLAFERVDGRSFYALNRVVVHGIALAQVIIERGQGGELAPDGGAGEALLFQVGAPGQNVAARDGTEFLGLNNAGERHEGAQVVLIRPPGLVAVEVGKPLGFRRHSGQSRELGRCQEPSRHGRGDVSGHETHSTIDNKFING